MQQRKKIVVLTGAGISAESGIPTFRDAGGLWEGHKVEDVATPEAWKRNPELVLDFYNQRRKAVRAAQPNAAHKALARLEEAYNVVIITQNIDDLHERAGSSRVLHLHGEILKGRSSLDPSDLYPLEDRDIFLGDTCRKGSQMRPHVVWFGEEVPMMERAAFEAADADIFMVVGTSLVVYPAAGLISYASPTAKRYLIDPNIPEGGSMRNVKTIAKKAGEGVPKLVEKLLEEAKNHA